MTFCTECGKIKKSTWDDFKVLSNKRSDTQKDFNIYQSLINKFKEHLIEKIGKAEDAINIYNLFTKYSNIVDTVKKYDTLKYFNIIIQKRNSNEFQVFLDLKMKYKKTIQLGYFK